jgi:hypothetical protein
VARAEASIRHCGGRAFVVEPCPDLDTRILQAAMDATSSRRIEVDDRAWTDARWICAWRFLDYERHCSPRVVRDHLAHLISERLFQEFTVLSEGSGTAVLAFDPMRRDYRVAPSPRHLAEGEIALRIKAAGSGPGPRAEISEFVAATLPTTL